jgi:hypothetical protein
MIEQPVVTRSVEQLAACLHVTVPREEIRTVMGLVDLSGRVQSRRRTVGNLRCRPGVRREAGGLADELYRPLAN